jgi:hypothetical protein
MSLILSNTCFILQLLQPLRISIIEELEKLIGLRVLIINNGWVNLLEVKELALELIESIDLSW